MSFSEESKLAGTTPVIIVEIDLTKCSLVYSESPCEAALDVTGDRKCYNTFRTCQDRDNFSEESVTYRFIQGRADLPVDINAFPFVHTVSTSPAELDVSGGLGVRGQVEIVMLDAPHHDRGIDPYVNDREFNPFERGTFWGKFLARNPYYQNAAMRVKYGYIVDGRINEANMEVLHYVIESIEGPSPDGRVRIVGKDVLKLASATRAQCPLPSTGVTSVELSESATSFDVSNATQYPDSGIFKVRLSQEIMRVTRSGTTLTVVNGSGSESEDGRAIDNTVLGVHPSGSTVQLVKEFSGETVPDIIEELLVDFAGVDPAFIPKSEWDNEQSAIGFVFGTQISVPTGVDELITQLLRSCGAFLWPDEREQKIKLRALRPTPGVSSLPLLNDDDNFIEGSIEVARRDDLRISEVWYMRGLRDSTQDQVGRIENYEVTAVRTDEEAGFAEGYEQTRRKMVWGRWLITTAALASRVISDKILSRYLDTPREITFSVDAKDWDHWLGGIIAARHRNLQDDTGDDARVPFQITRARFDGRDKVEFVALEYRVRPTAEQTDTLIIDANTSNYNVRQQYEAQIGPIEDEPIFLDLIIESGVLVTGSPPITGGGMPEGSVITLTNNGQIRANGGAAGAAGGALTDGAAFGGGGGGGARGHNNPAGGAGGITDGEQSQTDGAAGGAGSGSAPGNGGDGAGLAGDGGDGATWATAGSVGESGTHDGYHGSKAGIGGAGGAAGPAVKRNGFDVEVIDGGPGDPDAWKGAIE